MWKGGPGGRVAGAPSWFKTSDERAGANKRRRWYGARMCKGRGEKVAKVWENRVAMVTTGGATALDRATLGKHVPVNANVATCRHLPHVQRPLGCKSANDDKPRGLAGGLSHRLTSGAGRCRKQDRKLPAPPSPAADRRSVPFRVLVPGERLYARCRYYSGLPAARCTSKMAASR